MRAHYSRTAKKLRNAIKQLESIASSGDLPALHMFVVELKTSLPERLSYENSQILLEGLQIHSVSNMPEYADRLRSRLTELYEDYLSRSK